MIKYKKIILAVVSVAVAMAAYMLGYIDQDTLNQVISAVQ